MKSTPKWLLVPPVVALLLVLGPMAMQQGEAQDGKAPAQTPVESAPRVTPPNDANPSRAGKTTGLVPRTPDMWQVGSTLIGVLLLGVGGMLALKKLRGGATPSSRTPVASLRQTLRLSTRQAVHAIEFDDRVLLVGESDKGLTLLDQGRLPESVVDEIEVTSRAAALAAAHAAAEADDEGAVPKNLVIPRPATPPARRPITPPSTQPAKQALPGLNDFRALLQKAGR